MNISVHKVIAVLGFLIVIGSTGLISNTVKFQKDIRLNGGDTKNTLTSVLFGKKKKMEFYPSSICRISHDRLCTTDGVNGAVIIIDNNGNFVKKITHVNGARIISPVSVCGDGEGNFYVSDSSGQTVLLFDSNYRFIKIFFSESQSRITGLVFIRQQLYCVDTQGHRMLCFNRDGKLKFAIGKRGRGDGQFNFPTHIAGDDRNIYVTDAMNFRIQVFDHDGRFIRSFGTQGHGGGNFSKPKGIAVDSKQRIYVTDAMFDNVQIFSLNGEFLYYFGSPGHMSGEFWMPSGIMIDSDETIWVADTYNKRLQLFRLQEDTL